VQGHGVVRFCEVIGFPKPALFTRITVYGLLCILLLAAVEVLGRIIFRDRLYVVNDVDHRMRAGSAPDLNEDGIRSPRAPGEFRHDGVNIIFLGDSFVYGDRLKSEDSIPALLERIARTRLQRDDIRVANFGWPSSSPLLSFRLLRDIGRKYHPRVVLLAIDMTDFSDDIKYRRLLERRSVYRMLDVAPVTFLSIHKVVSTVPAFHGVHERVFGFPARRFFVTDAPLARNRHHYGDIERNIQEIYRYTTNELGARFVLFVFPRTYQYSTAESPRNWEAAEYEPLGPHSEEPFRYFDELRRRAPYPIHSLLEDFRKTRVFPTAFDDDPHWNEAGAQVAAEALYRYCSQAACFQ
jgi:hypothetical protein